mmetsp:Transcript_35613/g.90928  ORF Transcript_35613/g.90928 Transcript_35613/m.90928 type:complete len:272 (-) Transcript_35613:245-1060(-)
MASSAGKRMAAGNAGGGNGHRPKGKYIQVQCLLVEGDEDEWFAKIWLPNGRRVLVGNYNNEAQATEECSDIMTEIARSEDPNTAIPETPLPEKAARGGAGPRPEDSRRWRDVNFLHKECPEAGGIVLGDAGGEASRATRAPGGSKAAARGSPTSVKRSGRISLASPEAFTEAALALSNLQPGRVGKAAARGGTRKCTGCEKVGATEWQPGPQGPGTLCEKCGAKWVRSGGAAAARRLEQKTGGASHSDLLLAASHMLEKLEGESKARKRKK